MCLGFFFIRFQYLIQQLENVHCLELEDIRGKSHLVGCFQEERNLKLNIHSNSKFQLKVAFSENRANNVTERS